MDSKEPTDKMELTQIPWPNGVTWTLIPEDFINGVTTTVGPGFRNIETPRGDERHAIIFRFNGEDRFLVDRQKDELASYESIQVGALNLIIDDSRKLVELLGRARRGERQPHYMAEQNPGPEEALTRHPLGRTKSYFEILVEAGERSTLGSVELAVESLAVIANTWEEFFAEFPHLLLDFGGESSMTMYGDDMATYTILDSAPFLRQEMDTREPIIEDFAISRSLVALRRLAWLSSTGADIYKRCRESEARHIDRTPGLRFFYEADPYGDFVPYR
jgi:hypothetical protein